MTSKAAELKSIVEQEPVENLLVIDLEANCDDKKFVMPEIIEFPIVCVDGLTGEIKDVFRTYIRPLESKISNFCTKLTGITQEMVDVAPYFGQAWDQVLAFLEEKNYNSDNSVCITFGSSDLGVMLPNQLAMFGGLPLPLRSERYNRDCVVVAGIKRGTTRLSLSPPPAALSGGESGEPVSTGSSARKTIAAVRDVGIEVPKLFEHWYDIKRSYQMLYKVKITNFESMVKHSGITKVGRSHSGLDDSINTATILKKMIADGYGIGRSVETGDTPICQ
jgi:inhibitor of KinA sporulation pathway (predicted exonuclease)